MCWVDPPRTSSHMILFSEIKRIVFRNINRSSLRTLRPRRSCNNIKTIHFEHFIKPGTLLEGVGGGELKSL